MQKSFAPIKIPDDVWWRSATIQFLRDRDVANLLRAVQQYAGVSQARLAAALDVSQGRLNELIHSKRTVTALGMFERIADGLGMPDTARMTLGLAPARPDEVRSAGSLEFAGWGCSG